MIREEYEIRVDEVNRYFTFLERIENYDYSRDSSFIDEGLVKILKANGYLLLYNLIESSVYYSIKEIFDELKNFGLTYNQIIPELKKFWLKQKFKSHEEHSHLNVSQKSYEYIEEIINNLPIELIIEKIEYGGTLTPNKIRKIASEIGLNFNEINYKQYPNGEALVRIKEKRNDLAHGKYSFGQIGRDLSYLGSTRMVNNEDRIVEFGLIHFKQFAIDYITFFINSVETYIQNQHYKVATG